MSTLAQPLSRAESLRDMKIGLFIPCYIDLVYPEVGIATLELLERFGLDVDYPLTQKRARLRLEPRPSGSGTRKGKQPGGHRLEKIMWTGPNRFSPARLLCHEGTL
jgi:hypothetical protein